MARILIVNDEPELVDACAYALEAAGHEGVPTTDPEKAVPLALEASPDLLLLDLVMRHTRGEEVLRALRMSAAPRVPVIVMSALADGRSRATAMGADAYLPKPFDEDTLLRVVRETLRGARDRTARLPANG